MFCFDKQYQVLYIDQNITLFGDLRLLVPSSITSNRKLKPEVTGHRTCLYLYIYSHVTQEVLTGEFKMVSRIIGLHSEMRNPREPFALVHCSYWRSSLSAGFQRSVCTCEPSLGFDWSVPIHRWNQTDGTAHLCRPADLIVGLSSKAWLVVSVTAHAPGSRRSTV